MHADHLSSLTDTRGAQRERLTDLDCSSYNAETLDVHFISSSPVESHARLYGLGG